MRLERQTVLLSRHGMYNTKIQHCDRLAKWSLPVSIASRITEGSLDLGVLEHGKAERLLYTGERPCGQRRAKGIYKTWVFTGVIPLDT
jgi:hypothetical protein